MPSAMPFTPIETLQVAGRTLVDMANLIELQAFISTNTRSNFMQNNAVVGAGSTWAVPAGKNFFCKAIRLNGNLAAVSAGLYLLYSNADIGLDSVTAFTTPIQVFSGMGTGVNMYQVRVATDVVAGAANAGPHIYEIPTEMVIPANKFPGIQSTVAVALHVTLYGYAR